ncbi:hypothetical protein EDB19DRAFT_956041 [Suillus lakei]|nr:hypothetical protein EDB19DRAFT_956041 [Suillus lakei]
MIVHGKYIHTLVCWLRHIIKAAAFRSYRSLLSVLLQLFRHCQSVANGKQEDFRERPNGVALSSSQPLTNQPDPAPPVTLSLAVPLLEAPLQDLHSLGSEPGTTVQNLHSGLHGRSNDAAFDADVPPNSSGPLMPSPVPELSISEGDVATPPALAAPRHFDNTLTPIVPDQVNRYGRNVRVKDKYEAFLVTKGPLDYSEELAAVEGWEPLTHPEGALIFYHPYKRVFTDADARDPETALKLGKAIEKAKEEAGNAGITLDPYVELALELITKDGKWMWGYFFVDHKKRVIFWFEDHSSDPLMNKIRGVERKSHIKYALESQYWRHVELFPNRRFLPEDVVVTLKEVVMHAHAKNITSETCLAPFSLNEVASMLSLVDLLKGESFPDTGGLLLIVFSDSTNKEREHSVWIAARLMRLFCNAKFVNFCGQPGARLDVDQSLYGEYDTRSKMIILRVVNVVLFGSLDSHSKAIRRIWVDETIVQPRWRNFIDRLATEWNTYAIFSTVVLAANISFLGVLYFARQTSGILCTYLSIICAIGSLVVTLCLVGLVNDSLRGTVADVPSFMVRMPSSMLGLESLALMLSLPFALLIWGMIFFAAALSAVIFGTSDTVIVSIAFPVWAAVFVLATWPVLAANGIHVSQLKYWIIDQVCRVTASSYVSFV